MEVGLGSALRNVPYNPRPFEDIYQEYIEDVVIAEELGFDEFWFSEHHFSADAWCPSALTFLAACASRTTRIRLGTFVLLLALHNPIRIAEDAAVVDLISRGRLDLGIGPGPEKEECDVFGIEMGDRFNRTYEALQIIERCWAEEEFSHEGEFFNFPNVTMTTKPVQKPGPPIFIAAMGPQSAVRAARRGYSMVAGAGRGYKAYQDALAQFGRSEDDVKVVSVPLTVHVAPTVEQAWDEAEEGIHNHAAFYYSRGLPIIGTKEGPIMQLPPMKELRDIPGVSVYGDPIMFGPPDVVLKGLEKYRGIGIDQLVPMFQYMAMSPTVYRRSMETFAREVIPEVRRWT